tara:strand:+ start:168 stop:452 length:285 start_codon:yes stop_codon:yes gene_type:complete
MIGLKKLRRACSAEKDITYPTGYKPSPKYIQDLFRVKKAQAYKIIKDNDLTVIKMYGKPWVKEEDCINLLNRLAIAEENKYKLNTLRLQNRLNS